jgi:hypothetical protein
VRRWQRSIEIDNPAGQMHDSDGPGTLSNMNMISWQTQKLKLLLQDGISKIYQDGRAEPRCNDPGRSRGGHGSIYIAISTERGRSF